MNTPDDRALRPRPPMPAECSMAGYDWFPFYPDRLRKSRWWRRASDLARARNVMLWGEAFKQVPAGSLPDDDDELAEAAGFGMDVDAFIAAKAEIMAAWVLCSDGRWYHPTLCEVLLEVWDRLSERRKASAAKKAAQRAKTRGHGSKPDDVPASSPDVPGDNEPVPGDTGECPRGQGDTRQDKTRDNPPTPQGGGDEDLFGSKPSPAKPVDEVRLAFDLWNETAERCGLSKAESLNDGRRKHIKARLAESGLDGWRRALKAVEVSRHCRGMTPPQPGRRPWSAHLDFMLQSSSFAKLLEGFYGDGAPPPRPKGAPAPAPVDPWVSRVREFKANLYWLDVDWGPRPGRPGCEVPANVLRDFGFEPSPPRAVAGRA